MKLYIFGIGIAPGIHEKIISVAETNLLPNSLSDLNRNLKSLFSIFVLFCFGVLGQFWFHPLFLSGFQGVQMPLQCHGISVMRAWTQDETSLDSSYFGQISGWFKECNSFLCLCFFSSYFRNFFMASCLSWAPSEPLLGIEKNLHLFRTTLEQQICLNLSCSFSTWTYLKLISILGHSRWFHRQ